LDNNEWGKWWIYNMDSYRFYSKIVVKKGNWNKWLSKRLRCNYIWYVNNVVK
jgi:hypothetical protein